MKQAYLNIFSALIVTMMFAMSAANAADDFIIVQSTTSTQNSGLFDAILPAFKAETGIEVRVVAVGTGQAIRNAQNGDGDVLFVHAKPAEEKFVAQGWGAERFDVMYNDFVIVGPPADLAAVSGMRDAVGALRKIANAGAAFASRGDDSGTHKAELSLWARADVNVTSVSGSWYRETGSGMGATLNIATGMNAYVMTDRATWISFGNKHDYQILVEGDKNLFNQYGVILVNSEKFPNARAKAGQKFVDWITGENGQAAINRYNISGQQLFFANASRK